MKYAAYTAGRCLWVLACRRNDSSTSDNSPNDISIFEWYMTRSYEPKVYGVRAATRYAIASRTLKKVMSARGGWPREPWKLYGVDK